METEILIPEHYDWNLYDDLTILISSKNRIIKGIEEANFQFINSTYFVTDELNVNEFNISIAGTVEFNGQIVFYDNLAHIKAQQVIFKNAKLINAYPQGKLVITSHTDIIHNNF